MKQFAGILLIIAVLLEGCGHKSDVERTNIEQFKCQDSIQTVFNVLGETEMKTNTFIGECYTYENLNLYGYNGEVIFRVRDNKDTISSFECNFELSKKEFEDILSQLSDKYGECKKNEYSNQIAYVWEISEDKAGELGYNRISFSDYGDKKAVLDFSDEWSTYKDEVYYQHLEEEKEIKALAQKTYNIGDDTFDFSLEERENGEYRFSLLCHVDDKSDSYMTHISLNALFNSDEEALKVITETMNFAYTIIVGDGTTITKTKGALLIISKEGETISIEDYFSPDWITRGEFLESDYGTQVTNFLVDFVQNE